jgi:hypothetical protein
MVSISKTLVGIKKQIISAAIIALITILVGWAMQFLYNKWQHTDQQLKASVVRERIWMDKYGNQHKEIVTIELTDKQIRQSQDSTIVAMREDLKLNNIKKHALISYTKMGVQSNDKFMMYPQAEFVYKDTTVIDTQTLYHYESKNLKLDCTMIDSIQTCTSQYNATLDIINYRKKNGRWFLARWINPRTDVWSISSDDKNAEYRVNSYKRIKN